MNDVIIPPGARERKCCPFCRSLSITLRKSKRNYLCAKCGQEFKVPSKKISLNQKTGAYTTNLIKTRIVKLHSQLERQ